MFGLAKAPQRNMDDAALIAAVKRVDVFARVLPEQKLQMDLQHYYEAEIADLGIVTHVRFNMFPDGGVSRLRLWGVLE